MGEGGQTKRDQAKYSCNPRLTRAYLWLHLSVIQLIRACPDPQRSHLKIQSLLPLYQLYLPECFNCISLNVSTVFSSKIQLKIKSLLPQALTVPLLHQQRKFVFGSSENSEISMMKWFKEKFCHKFDVLHLVWWGYRK